MIYYQNGRILKRPHQIQPKFPSWGEDESEDRIERRRKSTCKGSQAKKELKGDHQASIQ